MNLHHQGGEKETKQNRKEKNKLHILTPNRVSLHLLKIGPNGHPIEKRFVNEGQKLRIGSSLTLKNMVVPLLPQTPTNDPRKSTPNGKSILSKSLIHHPQIKSGNFLGKTQEIRKWERKEAPNLKSHWAMHKEMIDRFNLFHTHNTSICQVLPSTLEMIEGQNFIQIRIPQKETNLWRDSSIPNPSKRKQLKQSPRQFIVHELGREQTLMRGTNHNVRPIKNKPNPIKGTQQATNLPHYPILKVSSNPRHPYRHLKIKRVSHRAILILHQRKNTAEPIL